MVAWIWVIRGLRQVAKSKRDSRVGRWGTSGQEFVKAVRWVPVAVADTTSDNVCFTHYPAAQEAGPRPQGTYCGKQGPSPPLRHPLRY